MPSGFFCDGFSNNEALEKIPLEGQEMEFKKTPKKQPTFMGPYKMSSKPLKVQDFIVLAALLSVLCFCAILVSGCGPLVEQ